MSAPDGPQVLPAAPGPGAVPVVSEREMWAAELAYLPENDALLRQVQFVIRTAVRAQELAKIAGTNPVDELLDARAAATTAASRQVYETAMTFLRRGQELQRDCWGCGFD